MDRTKRFADFVARPIKLRKNRVWRTYRGGKLLEHWQGLPIPRDADFPEEWVSSTVRARNVGREHLLDEGLSRIAENTGGEVTLAAVIESNPGDFLGETHVKKFGSNLAVLVKVLDSLERLSIQVHPDRAFARQAFGSAFGKTEAWYILGGRPVAGNDPFILLGFKPGMTRGKWQDLFVRQDIQAMQEALHRIPLKEGEVFLIEGCVPHAIGSGCFLIEIQEPTDYTLRTERTTPAGRPLPDSACHQGLGFDGIFDCFHYEAYSYEETLRRWRRQPRTLTVTAGGCERVLIGKSDTDRFRMHAIDVTAEFAGAAPNGFAIAIIVAGRGKMIWDDHTIEIAQADMFFIPAQVPPIRWKCSGKDELKVICCYPPE